MIVMDRHFRDAEARVVDLLHQLEADDAAVLFEADLFEDAAAHQAEVAVDVAHAQAEQRLHGVMVEPPDHDAVPGVGPADLVAVHQIDVVGHPFPEQGHLAGIVLGVAVGVEDELLARGLEAAAQGAAVAAILLMMNDPDLGIDARELVEDLRREVAAAVVDHDDFVIGREPSRRQQRVQHHAGDGAAVVVRGEEDAQSAGADAAGVGDRGSAAESQRTSADARKTFNRSTTVELAARRTRMSDGTPPERGGV